jgi:hypothetical protein
LDQPLPLRQFTERFVSLVRCWQLAWAANDNAGTVASLRGKAKPDTLKDCAPRTAANASAAHRPVVYLDRAAPIDQIISLGFNVEVKAQLH